MILNFILVTEVTNERQLVEVLLKSPSIIKDESSRINFLKDLLGVIGRTTLQQKVEDYARFLSEGKYISLLLNKVS